MANQSSNCPPLNSTQNHTNKPISSFLGSPRLFNGLLTRSLSDTETIKTSWGRLYDTETVTSPNSILDSMQSLNLGNPFGYERKPSNSVTKKPPNNKLKLEIIKTSSQFQISRGQLYDAESTTNPINLVNPFGYDRKSPNSITKKPPNIKATSTSTRNTSQFQISRGRLYDAECVASPDSNSILDNMQSLNLGNPFGYDRKSPNSITKMHPNKKMESESIGLALIDPESSSEKSLVLFGAKLKVEIPCSIEMKNTCEDFGEIESSEDYTCVITHGPNPKTTHIFDNCIIESCCGVRKLRESSCHTEGKNI